MTQRTTGISILAAVTILAACAPAPAAKKPARPVKVFILAGQSNMQGQGVVDMNHPKYYNGGKGTLEHMMTRSPRAAMYRHLKDKTGKWVVRKDVWVWYKTPNAGLKKGGLTIGYTGYGGKHHIGPELQFGHVVGDLFDQQVLLIKTAWGGKSLYTDFRPPSSGGQVGPYYTQMLAEIREALGGLKTHFPAYQGQGYQVAGFVWMQGWNDMCTPAAIPEYPRNLVNLITDLRKALKVPDLPVVVGELGNGGPDARGNMLAFRKAQAAGTADPKLGRKVAFIKTAQFARPKEQSPNVGHGHHWFGNAESYFLIGNALGEGMKKLLSAK